MVLRAHRPPPPPVALERRRQACGLNAKHQQAPQRERVFFNYLAKAYQMWMAGHDTFDSLLADLGQSFDKKNQTLEADISLAVEQQRRLRQQLEQLDRDQPPLSVLQQRKAELESDIGKYNKVIEILKAKNAKLSAGRAAQQQELEQLSTPPRPRARGTAWWPWSLIVYLAPGGAWAALRSRRHCGGDRQEGAAAGRRREPGAQRVGRRGHEAEPDQAGGEVQRVNPPVPPALMARADAVL